MSHYVLYVLMPTNTEPSEEAAEDFIINALLPYHTGSADDEHAFVDWWVLGGRYMDWLPDIIMPTPEVTRQAFAVLTPDGQWHQQARMLMFGETTEPTMSDAEWEATVQRLLKDHPDTFTLVVDCHQ